MGLDAETLKRALTRPQYEAVTSDARASLVLAGAGSGKTRVLVYKIARLLQEAAPDADGRPLDENAVMAVTFTNKAADEMRARIQSYLGRPVRMPWMGTFHSICVRILRRHLPEENGPRFRGRSFSIFDDDDHANGGILYEQRLGLDWCPRRRVYRYWYQLHHRRGH